jgi:hypothetical protein
MDVIPFEIYKAMCDTISDDFFYLASILISTGWFCKFLTQGTIYIILKNGTEDSISGW